MQTHPKHEKIAASGLTRIGGFEVFNPQMRICRATQRGPVWFVESVFPGYIFARFDLNHELDTVRYSASVSKVVHFKYSYPSIPDGQVGELQALFDGDDIVMASPEIGVGDKVRIVGGAFHDLLAIVQQILPAKQRVQALFEFLGSMTTVELDLHRVTVEERSKPRQSSAKRVDKPVKARTRVAV